MKLRINTPFMKTSLLALVLLFGASFVLAQTKVSVEDSVKETYHQLGYSLSASTVLKLKKGETEFQNKVFYSGMDYVVVAFSESEGVKDLDVYLYDDEGKLRFTDTNSEGDVKYSYLKVPEVEDDIYGKIAIKNFNSVSSSINYPCKVLIFYK